MPTLSDAHQLLQLLDITRESIHQIIGEWAKLSPKEEAILPSHKLFEAQRRVIAATGKLVELVSTPSSRLLEVSSQYNEARCLHIAATLRIPDILNKGEDEGVSIEDLAKDVGIEKRKLGRIMRCLCSIHIFQETSDGVFANNAISAALVRNEPLRAYIVMFGWDLYSASDALPQTLLDPEFGPSYSVKETAWQKAVGTTKERWNWLEEEIDATGLTDQQTNGSGGYPRAFGVGTAEDVNAQDERKPARRPELDIFGLAMLGGGRTFGVAHLYDFPWTSLGQAKVVDVGGGVGGFCLQLSKIYPELSFIVQDRAPALEQAKREIWPRENPEALTTGRVEFLEHDFFKANPVVGADIYWLRYILHDWSDDYCVEILSAIKTAMHSSSRILICDQVMNTTVGYPKSISSAPEPLPANYGYFARYSHQRDITMMSIINGIERTPAEFEDIIERAGLVISKIYDCRSPVSLVECVLPEQPTISSV